MADQPSDRWRIGVVICLGVLMLLGPFTAIGIAQVRYSDTPQYSDNVSPPRADPPAGHSECRTIFKYYSTPTESLEMARDVRLIHGANDEALCWLLKADAEAGGHAHVAYEIASMYEQKWFASPPIPKDDAEALKWYVKAARLGHPAALGKLGGFYENGTMGLKKDPDMVRRLDAARVAALGAAEAAAQTPEGRREEARAEAREKRRTELRAAVFAKEQQQKRLLGDAQRMARCRYLLGDGVRTYNGDANYSHPEWGWYRSNCP